MDFGDEISIEEVSIHVPLAEHDLSGLRRRAREIGFDSRGPRGARLPTVLAHPAAMPGFNSRAPRGARPASGDLMSVTYSFNSRAPRGARHGFRG